MFLYFRFLLLCECIFLLLINMSAMAQSPRSPYVLDRRKDLWVYGGSAVGFGVAQWIKYVMPPLSETDVEALDPNKVWKPDQRALDNLSPTYKKRSDYLAASAFVLSPALLLSPRVREDVLTVATLGLEAVFVTNALTHLSKSIAKRPRPFAYNEWVAMSRKTTKYARWSFFSGHTSNAAAISFFCARVYADYHPHSIHRPFVYLAAAALPAAVGTYRYLSGEHFASDVVVGYMVGAACGYLIPALHHRDSRWQLFSIAPAYEGKGVVCQLSF